MGSTEAVKNAIIEQPRAKSLQGMIQDSIKELGRALPEGMRPERLARIALTSIRLNPELSLCTPESFLGSLFVLAQMGLEPIAGRSYLLPFNNKRKIKGQWQTVKEVQAVIGYKGYVELFYRHESALSLDMQTVFQNDDFSYQYGTESFLHHKPALKDRGEVIGFYAVAKMKGGASIFRFMSKEDALEHGKKHSKTWNGSSFSEYSPWHKEPDAMCMKTVMLQLSKLLPLSVELQRAIEVDESSRDFRKGIEDAMDLPTTTHWQDEPVEAQAEPGPKEEKPIGEKAVEDIPFGAD